MIKKNDNYTLGEIQLVLIPAEPKQRFKVSLILDNIANQSYNNAQNLKQPTTTLPHAQLYNLSWDIATKNRKFDQCLHEYFR